MTDHPIRMCAVSMNGLLREIEKPGTGKSQTRRVLNPQPFIDSMGNFCEPKEGDLIVCWGRRMDGTPNFRDYIKASLKRGPGDRLWVRENWRTFVSLDQVKPRDLYVPDERGAGAWFEADGGGIAISAAGHTTIGQRDDIRAFGKLRPSMYMPRWASRITLYVTDVRVERLQDIGMNDALSEGVVLIPYKELPSASTISSCWYGVPRNDGGYSYETAHPAWTYGHLWDAINGLGSWETNPWVVAYSFVPVLGNIDTLPATLAEVTKKSSHDGEDKVTDHANIASASFREGS
jgi:hypothetical protein